MGTRLVSMIWKSAILFFAVCAAREAAYDQNWTLSDGEHSDVGILSGISEAPDQSAQPVNVPRQTDKEDDHAYNSWSGEMNTNERGSGISRILAFLFNFADFLTQQAFYLLSNLTPDVICNLKENLSKLANNGSEAFLPNSEDPQDLVNFNASLEDVDGQYVLNVTEYGLAYNTGFRTGDVLLEVNGTNIEGSGIDHVLDLLRNYSSPNKFLAFKRQECPCAKYIWVIFQILAIDRVPTILLLQTLENNEYKLPLISVEEYFEFNHKDKNSYDIFVDKGDTYYLAIDDKGNLVFQRSYAIEKSSFHVYRYSGGGDKGQVVAYSLQNIKPNMDLTTDQDDQKTTPAAKSDKSKDFLEVLDLPGYMVKKEGIHSSNPRFWYAKRFTTGTSTYIQLESVNADKLKYLGMPSKYSGSADVIPAVLLEEPYRLTVATS